MKKSRRSSGFSLIEIVVVVMIIGVIAALAVPALQNVRAQSQKAEVLKNLETVALSAHQYFMETGEKGTVKFREIKEDYAAQEMRVVVDEVYDELELFPEGGELKVVVKGREISYSY